MIDKELQEYRRYEHFIQTALTICGCWHVSTKSGKFMICCSLVYILLLILRMLLFVSAICSTRHGDFRLIMNYFSLAMGVIGSMTKVSMFLANRKSLINYNQVLNDLFEEELLRNKKSRTLILSSLRNVSSMAYLYIMLFVGYFMPLFLSIIRGLSHFTLSTNYTLPVTKGNGYPWVLPKNFWYHFYFLFEMMIICSTICSALGIDNAFGYYVYQIASILRAMAFRITNLLPTDNYSDVLKTCVEKHQILMPCRDTLEKIYGPIIFWHLIANAVILCTIIYQAFLLQTQSKLDGQVLISLLSYCGIKLLQTFSYSWYGTVLANAGEEFRMGIYFSRWFNFKLDRHMRANIILVMMQKPMVINAFYAPVNVVMFTNFLNSTVSYFFLLRSVRNE